MPVVAAGRSPAAGSGPWCSTPAAPTPAPGPRGFQDTHATAEQAGRRARRTRPGEIAVCSTGLIGERLPMDELLAGVERRRGRSCPGTAAWPPPTRSGPPTPCSKIAFTRGPTATRSAGWPRAPGMLAPGAGHHARACSPPTPTSTGRELDAALREATATTFDRLDTDGCMSTNDTVLLLASGAAGVDAGPGRVRRWRSPRSAPTWPGSCSARRRGRDQGHRDRGDRRGLGGRRGRPSAGRWPAATCSSAPSTAKTPTGAGCSAAVGTTDAEFEPDRLNVAINGIWVCRDGAAGDERGQGRPDGRGRDDHRRPVRRARTPPPSGPPT